MEEPTPPVPATLTIDKVAEEIAHQVQRMILIELDLLKAQSDANLEVTTRRFPGYTIIKITIESVKTEVAE